MFEWTLTGAGSWNTETSGVPEAAQSVGAGAILAQNISWVDSITSEFRVESLLETERRSFYQYSHQKPFFLSYAFLRSQKCARRARCRTTDFLC